MGSSTNIEWTDATPIVDRGGRRVRFYQRKRTDRPGTRERRVARARGERWCIDCHAWLPAASVMLRGRCREHTRAAERAYYALNRETQCARKVAAKRGRHAVPTVGRAALLDWFAGECAYCDALATTLDHIVPVEHGGETCPGQLLPACRSCNSAKNVSTLAAFLARRPRAKRSLIVDVLSLAEAS